MEVFALISFRLKLCGRNRLWPRSTLCEIFAQDRFFPSALGTWRGSVPEVGKSGGRQGQWITLPALEQVGSTPLEKVMFHPIVERGA